MMMLDNTKQPILNSDAKKQTVTIMLCICVMTALIIPHTHAHT